MNSNKKKFLAGLVILVILVGGVVLSKRFKKPLAQPLTQSSTPAQQDASSSPADYKNQKTKGPLDAPITILEYSDFQCPSCKNSQKPLEELFEKFPGLIQIHFKHFPLAMHRFSMDAARSAECAAKEGRFWDYVELLFNEQDTWSKDPEAQVLFMAYAHSLGINQSKFMECIRDPEIRRAIEIDSAQGRMVEINSTPTFFINGDRIVGGKQLTDNGAEVIRKKLESLVGNKKKS